MDAQNLAVKLLVKGRAMSDYIINGGCRVTIIHEITYQFLNITQWEPCPFGYGWPTPILYNPLASFGTLILFVLGGHTFTISAVVVYLEAIGAYPMLLG